MKLLLILAQYHPALNPNVYRWGAIATHWASEGHEVHVLCTKRSGLPDEVVMDGVQVHRAGQNSLLDWGYNLLNTSRRRGEAGGTPPGRHGKFRRGLEKVVDLSWRSFYWPDGRCLWYGPGRRKAKQLLKAYAFDGVISVGAPFTAHLIGLACKRANPKLHWLVDIEDPFAFVDAYFINNRRLYKALNFRAEAAVLKAADAISVTVDTAKQAYTKYFPGIESKIEVIPPLFDSSLGASPDFELFEPDRLHLSYFGAFYAPIRTPDAALKLLDLLFERHPELESKLVIHFFGEIEYSVRAAFERHHRLAARLRMHGLVDRDVVAAAMAKTTFLLHIGNTTTYNLPSKSADYLASGKPIVHLSASDPDTFQDFMGDYPMLFVAKADAVSVESADRLAVFLTNFQNRQLDKASIERRIVPFQTAQIAAAYQRLLQVART